MRGRLRPAFVVFVIGLAGIATTIRAAQSPPASARLAFEVATIKVNPSGRDGGSMGVQPGGRFRVGNLLVTNLIQTAFPTTPRLLTSQVLGLPDWATSTRYDMTAKVPEDGPTDAGVLYRNMGLYVRSLLEDRFGLQAHMEKRDLPVYAIVVAPGGPKLRPSTLDCTSQKDMPKCGITFNADRLTGHSLEVSGLIGSLTGATGRVVVDRTGIDGKFDIDLQWKPDASATDASDDRASIFTALQEQLGLKLESTRAPLDVVVVDRITRPTED